jgi:hypothetical protein|tara:strand:+ start:1627 stop:1869 length:243 start_codon:yes stop_codon:yes gene_type:complete
MAEGLFLDFTTSEITTILAKAKTLLTEGKTMMSYGVGGRNATKQFTLPVDQILRECRYALKRKDPATYGYASTRTYAKFR